MHERFWFGTKSDNDTLDDSNPQPNVESARWALSVRIGIERLSRPLVATPKWVDIADGKLLHLARVAQLTLGFNFNVVSTPGADH